MSPKQVEYHEGAGRDVKAAVAWYGKRSRRAASDFIEELNRAAQTIAAGAGSLAARQEQHPTVPALAISILHHLF
jgi:plasmid stabilization system protein ParE